MAKKSLLKKVLDMNYGDIIKDLYSDDAMLRKAVRELSKQANKQIRELKTDVLGEYSPAYQNLKDRGTKRFKIKDIETMDYNNLVSKLWEARNFLKADTSSLEGWKTYREETGARLRGLSKSRGRMYNSPRTSSGAKRTIDLEKKYWKIYQKLVDEFGAIISEQMSDVVQKKLWQIMNDKDMSQREENIIASMRIFMLNYNSPHFTEEEYDKHIKEVYGKNSYLVRMKGKI